MPKRSSRMGRESRSEATVGSRGHQVNSCCLLRPMKYSDEILSLERTELREKIRSSTIFPRSNRHVFSRGLVSCRSFSRRKQRVNLDESSHPLCQRSIENKKYYLLTVAKGVINEFFVVRLLAKRLHQQENRETRLEGRTRLGAD